MSECTAVSVFQCSFEDPSLCCSLSQTTFNPQVLSSFFILHIPLNATHGIWTFRSVRLLAPCDLLELRVVSATLRAFPNSILNGAERRRVPVLPVIRICGFSGQNWSPYIHLPSCLSTAVPSSLSSSKEMAFTL